MRLDNCCKRLALLAGLVSLGADWPGFRGPNGTGVSPERGLPVHWSDNENVLWKSKLPGPGTRWSISPTRAGRSNPGRALTRCVHRVTAGPIRGIKIERCPTSS